MRVHEIARGEDAKSRVPKAPCDLQGAGASHERIIPVAEECQAHRHERVDPAEAEIVIQLPGQGLGLAQAFQRLLAFEEQAQCRTHFEADIAALRQGGLARRQRLDEFQRLLEGPDGLAVG